LTKVAQEWNNEWTKNEIFFCRSRVKQLQWNKKNEKTKQNKLFCVEKTKQNKLFCVVGRSRVKQLKWNKKTKQNKLTNCFVLLVAQDWNNCNANNVEDGQKVLELEEVNFFFNINRKNTRRINVDDDNRELELEDISLNPTHHITHIQ
jgi:hypothetical protein